jgi:hypothetical protein
MTKSETNPVFIRNWNLDIVCHLVLGDWCFRNVSNVIYNGLRLFKILSR